MYQRSYADEGEELSLPDGYSGTSMSRMHTESVLAPNDGSGDDNSEETVKSGLFSGWLSKLPFGETLSGLFTNGKFGIRRFGSEELLIIAAAAFLFFSHDGDKECAILLLLLLFIS